MKRRVACLNSVITDRRINAPLSSVQKLIGIMAATAAAAVRVGKIYIAVQQVDIALARYGKQICIDTGFAEFPYCLMGSATCIRVDNKYFAICCGHQIDTSRPESVALISQNTKEIFTGSSLHRLVVNDSNADTDYIDIRAIQFYPDRYTIPNLEQQFFNIDDDEVWPSDNTLAFTVFGYPSIRQQVEYEERHHIHSVQVTGAALYHGGSHSPHLHCLQLQSDPSFDVDGLSGGPVFHIASDLNGYFAGFAGVIVRGGNGYLYFIEGKFVVSLARNAESETTSSTDLTIT